LILMAGGLGLGLALVKSFAERQGGNVCVISDGPGSGSEFVVRLPAALAGNPPAVAPVPRAELGGGPS
jgi:signal transduction histidine kinase